MKKGVQYTLFALLLLVVAGVAAPFIRVDHYREQIRLGLERGLHRKVEIYGDAHLSLFRGPGFSVEKVVIYDDPGVGLEPLANVAELQTAVSFTSLFTGHLDFGTVRLVEPSLNLVKPENGSWNALAVLAGAGDSGGKRLPEIKVSNGRINFKFGQTKSAFYLTDTDLTIAPARDGVEIRFSGAPARTDRTQQPYGLFSGRGRIAGGNIELDAQLEKSPVEELVTLVRGQSLGLHGNMASRARISGPLLNPQITGRFEVDDIHRWDQNPGQAGVFTTEYRGSFDARTQHLEISAEKPFPMRLAVDRALTQPEWQLEAEVKQLPAGNLVAFVRHMGAPLPSSMTTEGTVDGIIRYGSAAGITGNLSIENATFRFDGGPEIRLDVASLAIEGDQIRLLPAAIGNGQIEAVYAPFRQRLEAEVKAKGMKIAPVVYGISIPVLGRFRGGTWSGSLHYLSDGGVEGVWSADISIRDTATAVPGIARPVQISAADVNVDGDRLNVHRIRAVAGPIEVYGEYRYEPEEGRPHQFTLSIPSADLGELEELLMPTLQHGGSSFLARTLRWRGSVPDWLRERRAAGELRIGTLTAGEMKFRALRTRVLWAGTTVQLSSLESRIEEGSVEGKLTADLSRAVPRYTMSGEIRNLPWKSGHVDLDGSVASEGVGTDVLANLTADGKFQARGVSITPETVRTASGIFGFSVTRTGPQIRLSGVQAAVGSERFNGEGGMQPDGRLQVDMASATRAMRVSGTLAALKLAINELPAR